MLNPIDLLEKQPYWLQFPDINFADAAAIGVTAESTVRVSDQPFVCTAILVWSRVDDFGTLLTADDISGNQESGGFPEPGILLAIDETGTNRSMSNVAIDGATFAAGLRNGGRLVVPKYFKPSATVHLVATLQRVIVAGSGLDVRVVLEGFQAYGALAQALKSAYP